MATPFDLSAPAVRWLWKKGPLGVPTVHQSFAFDEVHQHLYVLQVTPHGGEKGDLCLSRLTYEGKLLGHMMLRGFGHGVSMGVQNADDGTVRIWTETDARGGYGTGVTHFGFKAGTTLTVKDVTVLKPIPGSTSNQPSVCMTSKRIAVRHRMDGEPRYRVWDLDTFLAGNYGDHLTDCAMPAPHPDPEVPFQGYALHGDHVYQLAGSAYDDIDNPPAKRGNAYLSCVDIHTGKLVQRMRTQAGFSLDYREPEGVAVRGGAKPWLCMGLASGAVGSRRISVYYKPLAAKKKS
ncbi:Teichoic acid biosynthesis protein C (Precursor) [Streptomyces sp. NPDC047072]|uniref:phage baseplate protein n=1 Tax=Streptomyces sp. NPDC047072 TaxID=3154809 RepID=UPI0033D7184B